jgi:hypothetical protein
VAAESFTAGAKEAWQLHPGIMKPQADWALCMGINRLVFHRYAHQPWLDRWPGMTMGPYGVHYERTQTWWPMVGAWHQYLARCQTMLRRGLPVADICYLAPEGAPHVFRPPTSALAGGKAVPDRKGHNFDGCAPDTLLHATVNDSQLVLPGGTTYRVLVLPQMDTMTPALLRKIRDLVRAGVTVIGPRPLKSPGLSDYPQCDREVQRLAAELWGTDQAAERRVGRGRIVTTKPSPPDSPAEPAPSLPANTRWIWYPEGSPAVSAPVGTRLFRRTFTIAADARIESARLLLTADNAFQARVNDQPVGEGDNFKLVHAFDVGPRLKPGVNLLTVLAENGGQSPNPAGLIGALIIRFSAGRTETILTDRQWETAETAQASWRPALELGELGMAPWGPIGKATGPQKFPDLYCEYNMAADVLGRMSVPPDFESDAGLRYTHRRDGPADIYFVANPADHPVAARCLFRVTGRQPEVWDPMTGATHMPSGFVEKGARTQMELSLEQGGSAFVVFGSSQHDRKVGLPVPSSLPASAPIEIHGPWQVRFQPGRGAPERIVLEKLVDWSQHPDPGVKYFSGQATYSTTFPFAPASGAQGARLMLDLGRVQVMAQVTVNGKNVGVAWRSPFQVDITSAVQPGENRLEITVANLWPNRLIGDQVLPPEQRVAWTTWNPFKKDTPLLESGLLGPVCCKIVHPTE